MNNSRILLIFYDPVIEFLKKNLTNIKIICIREKIFYNLFDLKKIFGNLLTLTFIKFPVKYITYIDNKGYVKFESVFYFLLKFSKNTERGLYDIVKTLLGGNSLKWCHENYLKLLTNSIINEFVLLKSYKDSPFIVITEKNKQYKIFKFLGDFCLRNFMFDAGIQYNEILFSGHVLEKTKLKFLLSKEEKMNNKFKIKNGSFELIKWKREDVLKMLIVL